MVYQKALYAEVHIGLGSAESVEQQMYKKLVGVTVADRLDKLFLNHVRHIRFTFY